MFHNIPPEYAGDARMISAYNDGYCDGYCDAYTHAFDHHRDDYERLAYANGRREGQLKRRAENGDG